VSRGPGDRMRKVDELLREVVADAVTELKDPRLGFVTITGVDTAPDLRTAVVYYSVLGSEDAEATAAALRSAAARLQREVGAQTRLKFTPRLRFAIDESIAAGDRIERILRDLREDRPEEDS
jgi:ribosome-binding factor A